MGASPSPLSRSRDSRRASTAGDSTAARRAPSSLERGPGGGTRISGNDWPLRPDADMGRLRDHAVTSRALRFVELLVRAPDEVRARAVLFGQHRGARRDGDADGLALEHEAALLDLLAKAFGQGDTTLEVGLGQDDREL